MQSILRTTSKNLAKQVPRPLPVRQRLLSTRPHPLASPTRPTGARVPQPRWSTTTVILLATATGASTFVFGLLSAKESSEAKAEREGKTYRDPTAAGFASAMREVEEFLPEDCVDRTRQTLLEHGFSEWTYHDPSGLPGAVLYPRSTEDVVRIVKLAAKYAIPIIPYSGGTSLEGHFSPVAFASNPADKDVVEKQRKGEKVTFDDVNPGLAWTLDFAENMNQIIKINGDDLDVVVQPGVSYDVLNATLKEEGVPLFFPVDPAPGAMIGGMVGTGASGTNAVRYGTMRENVVNLTVVLPSGEVIKTRSRAHKSSAGPDMSKIFIGAEGTLGLVVEATLKLSPLLPTSVAVSSFASIQHAADSVKEIIQQGVGVACVELLDDVMMKVINSKPDQPYKWEEKASLFLKFSGTPAQIKEDVERVRQITKKNGGSKFTFAKNDQDAEIIWYSRKVALLSALDYLPGSRCWVTDVCVPISSLPQLVAETKADLEETGILGPIVGHAGDGNFHALLLFRDDEEKEKVKGLVHRMVERAQRLDGTSTGEHGIGIGKREYLDAELGTGTVDLMRSIKKIIDPQNIMNPGKLLLPKGGGGHSH